MSHERHRDQGFAADERQPSEHGHAPEHADEATFAERPRHPAHGLALSVLWWEEGEPAEG